MATAKAIAIREQAAIDRIVALFGNDIHVTSKDEDLRRAMQLEAIADKAEALAADLSEARNVEQPDFMDAARNATVEDLMRLPSVGEVTAQKIFEGLHQ